MITSRLASILLLSTVGAGCGAARSASGPPTAFEATDEIVERPAAPALVGQGADLAINNGVLSGRLEGGAYHVTITPDQAVGSGPMGRVDVHIKRTPSGHEMAGLWNGGKVHFFVGEDGARGELLKQISGEDRGYESCFYDIEKRGNGPGYTGLSECLGAAPLRFEVRPQLSTELSEEQTAILLLAYFAAPPPVRTL
jgi:hypothetical protein